ncbi:MAG: DUF1064 domain-containing protein [Phycisphaerae bacterium]
MAAKITREMLGPACQKQWDAAMATRGRPGKPTDESPMNRWESQYAGELELLKHAGVISHWGFETIKLRLAKKTWYTPDFFVIREGRMEFHEVKGFWRDDARVKVKVAAENCRWATFVIVTKESGTFAAERVVP